MRSTVYTICLMFLVLFVPACRKPTTPRASAGSSPGGDAAEVNRSDPPAGGELAEPVGGQPNPILCDCAELADQLTVDVEEESLPPITDRVLNRAGIAPAVDTDLSDLQAFFGNLHSHTSYSDGSGVPEEAFAHARDVARLDFLALTEHNHRSAGQPNGFHIAVHHDRYEGPRDDALVVVANRITENGRFVALYGQEFSSISRGNHVNVFDVPRVIDDTEIDNGDFDALLNTWLPTNFDSFGQQALLQLNHPWNSNSPNELEFGRDDFDDFASWRSALGSRAHLIEVINGPSHETGAGLSPATVNAAEFRRYLKMGFRLAPTANQDNHFPTWGTITHARTAVLATELTKAAVVQALRSRHAYASLDRNLRILFTVEGKLMGSEITDAIADNQPLNIEITLQDGDEAEGEYWIELYADMVTGEDADSSVNLIATYGPLSASNNIDEAVTWELLDVQYEGWDYLYARVLQGTSGSNQGQAYLAPVWFD